MRGAIVLLAGVAGAVAGCSSILGADFDRALATDAGPDTTEPTEGGAADASPTRDGGSSGDGAADSAADSEIQSGFVDLGLTDDSTAASAGAVFYPSSVMADDANHGLDTTCYQGVRHGDCISYTCVQPPPPMAVLPRPISAGPVSVTGMYTPFEIDPTVGAKGAVYAVAGSGVPGGALVPGELVTVSAPGEAFPAFSLQVSLPPRLDLSSSLPATEEPGVDTAISWTAVSGTADLVQVTFFEMDGSDVLQAQCSFSLGAGQGTLPGALWSEFVPAQPVTVTAVVLASTMAYATAGANGAITLTASTAAYVASGSKTTATLTVN